ncbi:MAG: hypothetical protein CMG11_04525 [Candidatus Marinimicrobia bacterium]|nr:hypothetical protein [Candidatus Neomarinimicrobiota bacterium]|tara:strand:- start:2297 stop:2866 length:570 start_codon:yes stop_codon:yes gene_type:complete
MSFEVKNIEQENINFKMIGPLTLFVIVTVVASMVFVYYYFIFEKDSIMREQYLEAESKIGKEYRLEQQKQYDALNINKKIEALAENYSKNRFTFKKSIEERLKSMTLEEQLLSDAFEELVKRGESNKSKNIMPHRGVQDHYTKDQIKKIQVIVEDPDVPYKERGEIPDGIWGVDTKYEWKQWKRRANDD